MRIVIIVLAVLLARPAWAAEIVGPLAMGCSDVGWYSRAYRMLRAGDRAAAERLIEASIADGTCKPWPVGLKVRIEETRFPHVCVAPLGSIEPCRWLEAREVKP